MRRFTVLFAACWFAVCVAASAQDKKEPAKDESTAEEKSLVELTNKERAKENLPLLKINPVLSRVARAHSANMAKTGMFEHVLEGKTPSDRVKSAGYRFALCGENIFWTEGMFAADEIMKGWMDSKPHKANILNKRFTEIGIGAARTGKGEFYYTQVFGVPSR